MKSKFTNLKFALPILAVIVLAFITGRSTVSTRPTGSTGPETHGQAEEAHAGDDHQHEEEEHGHQEGHEHSLNEPIEFDEKSARSAGIALAPVSAAPVSNGISFNGQIEANPRKVVRVSSVVPGRVIRLLVSAGDKVQRGQTLAVVESRSVSEAQSAHRQAEARYQNAATNLKVVQQQARAGVFSHAPLEAARRAHSEAVAEVRAQETALRLARTGWDNTQRLARVGSFASPALEAARANLTTATEELETAEAALRNANAAAASANAELRRRRQLAAGGNYAARPVEEARRAAVNARSARDAAQSEVATTRANLNRARLLLAEGLVSQRDLESAQQAFDSAGSRLESSEEEAASAARELERQQKLAATGAAGVAEVKQAEAAVAAASADARTRRAEVRRAGESLKLARIAHSRESAIFSQGIANRREAGAARAQLDTAASALAKSRRALAVATSALQREERIFRNGLNTTAQLQGARSQLVQAAADLRAARTALALLKSSPHGSAQVPIRAPLSGVVQQPDIAQGEVITADKELMTISDLTTVHIDFYLPEAESSRVRAGMPFRATVDAVPGRTYSGEVELVHSEVDPKTRMVEAHAEIVNRGELRPGMFARGRLLIPGGASSSITVPADAVQSIDGKSVVYVPGTKPHSYVAREVKTGASVGGRIVIVSGLRAGERVVVKGAFMVKAQAMKAELGHNH